MHRGWIPLYRKSTDNPFYFAEPFDRFHAWIDLIILANYKETFFYKRGVKVTVGRGQVGWSKQALAERWQWSKYKVRTFFSELEKEKQIEQQKSNVTTLITIVNYDIYVKNGTADLTPNLTADLTPDLTHLNKVNKEKKKTSASKSVLSSSLKGSFDSFWKLYPKKVDKKKSEAEWGRLAPDDEFVKKLTDSLAEQKKSKQWTENNGQYIPSPLRWLKNEKWNDVLTPAESERPWEKL